MHVLVSQGSACGILEGTLLSFQGYWQVRLLSPLQSLCTLSSELSVHNLIILLSTAIDVAVKDLIDLVLKVFLNFDRRGSRLYVSRNGVGYFRFEKGNMEDWVESMKFLG